MGICKACGKEYKKDKRNKVYCPECRKKQKHYCPHRYKPYVVIKDSIPFEEGGYPVGGSFENHEMPIMLNDESITEGCRLQKGDVRYIVKRSKANGDLFLSSKLGEIT